MSHPHQVSTIKGFNPDDSFSLEGIDDGTFAIASSKKELKQLKKSDADVVYDERKGKLYINGNGTKKGWGKDDHDGLIAKFKGKPCWHCGYGAFPTPPLRLKGSNAANGVSHLRAAQNWADEPIRC